ncbi:hypothetical protein LX64_01839 [Chitinophaga skermanii]|uniref:Uncharacterized protein n=1 Tax=Chitinophaga skermanii TaxID=331697 RepID=A0A327QSN9_9BACT|nr:hypothetical protein LX64_01839 [Chitinophaga skermanii]
MHIKKIIRYIPFIILLVFTLITWYDIVAVTHVARVRHLTGGILVLINIFTYFFSMRIGVLITGITLLLSTINLAAFTTPIITKQFWVGSLMFPIFQPIALLLLMVFLVLNSKYLSNAFKRERKVV